MQNILLIEDDLDVQELIKDYLKDYDFNVQSFVNPLDAIKHLTENKNIYSLIILDIMLPNLNGFEVCQKIRQISNIPIIISSALGEIDDKVLGFDLGADDYLAKPYEPRELVLRINSILKRVSHKNKIIDDFEINEDKKEVKIEGYTLDLTTIEYDILMLFLKNKNKVLSREVISNNVNGIEYNTKDRTIDMHISNLRHKIGDEPKNPQYIKSIWGIGYKYIR